MKTMYKCYYCEYSSDIKSEFYMLNDRSICDYCAADMADYSDDIVSNLDEYGDPLDYTDN